MKELRASARADSSEDAMGAYSRRAHGGSTTWRFFVVLVRRGLTVGSRGSSPKPMDASLLVEPAERVSSAIGDFIDAVTSGRLAE